MKIKPAVYENLTPHQRVLAALEAGARDDDAEIARLRQTCPKHTYRATDAAYTETMRAVTDLAIFLEMELRGAALWALEARGQGNPPDALEALREMRGLRQAWDEGFAAHGIDFALVERFAAPMRSPVVTRLLTAADAAHARLAAEDAEFEAAIGHALPPDMRSPLEPDPADIAPWREMVEALLQRAEK